MGSISFSSIKNWSCDDQPREKLLSKGKEALSNAELLSIILGSGSTQENVLELSKRILSYFDNDVHKLFCADYKNLLRFLGIGKAKALVLMSAFELSNRRINMLPNKKPIINKSDIAYEYIKQYLSHKSTEEFWVLFLNNAQRLIKSKLISKGGIASTTVDVRCVIREAINYNATNLVLIHNHPSGSSKPSKEDLKITNKIFNAAALLDIKVNDHIIFTDIDYYSFADNDMLENKNCIVQ